MYYFPHVCCICNCSNTNFKYVKRKDGEMKIADKIEYCVPEMIELKSPCAEYICIKCLEKLNIVYEFKLNCIKTHRTLFEYAKELEANDNSNSLLQVEVELTVKNEPIETEPDDEMVTVYRVEVIKESEEAEEKDSDTRYEDNLRDDLSQIAENITSYPDSECLSESVSMMQENLIYVSDSDMEDNKYDTFVGFTDVDIETSSVVSQRTLDNVNILTPIFTEKSDTQTTFSCQFCGIHFKTALNCQDHEMTHEDTKPNICLICMQILGPHIQLKDHLQMHFISTKDRTCDICNDVFATPSELYYHKTLIHEPSSYVCQLCSKQFTTKLRLTTHMNTHFRSEKDLVSCLKCGKKFTSQATCDRHYQLVHERIKPFKCHLCEKSFGMKHYLKKHLDSHTGVKPYQCPLCQKYFRYQESLTHHLKIHQKYKCPLCDEYFMTFKMMNEHERQHRSDLPYHCNFCSKNFKLASHLSNHISHKHHNEISSFIM